MALSSFKLFSGSCKFQNNLSAGEINSLEALMRKKIIIQKSDKSNTVVITDKEKCIEGVKNAISDSKKLVQRNIKLDKYLNYIINVQKKFKQLFKDLLDNEKISKDEYNKIYPKGFRSGIFYCNPIIHEPVVSNLVKFRSILSTLNARRCNTVKFLITILEPITHNEFAIKNSFNFAKVRTIYDSSLYMASLDVECLFINIPLNETINSCVSDLQNKGLYNGKLSKRDFYKLLERATSKYFFIFHYLLYTQVEAVAMGSPLSPTLANSFLCHYKREWLDRMSNPL